ncbi:MAG: response regulator [Cyanobacteria bacterium SBLK]|nr:response regulator [Cyanobacteria bacterium SBLK]
MDLSIHSPIAPFATAETRKNSFTIGQLPTSEDKVMVKVLLVDDQPIVAESIRRLLASEPDIELHYCNSAERAIPTALDIEPTVILQDLVMPEVDGLMMVKFFRANPCTHSIPIIVLSNREESTIKAEAFATGANDYLVKIPDPIEFVARLRYHSTAYANFCKRYEAEQALARANQELEHSVAKRTAELQATLERLQQTQAQLVQDEKMASLGQLVAGVAHEINNPVNFISGNINPAREYAEDLLNLIALYQQEYPQPTPAIAREIDNLDLDFLAPDFLKLLTSLKTGTDRIQEIVLSLRNFSHLDEAGMKLADIRDGIESTLLILGSKLRSIEIRKDYGDCPPIECLPGQLNQVFINLLANAADAIEEKVERMSEDEEYQPKICIRSQTVEDRWMQITIIDNGPGIPEEIRDRLFDPFFTTKSVGKGTGLGLSISYQIVVEKHGGTLDVASSLGEGTKFTIKIPLRSE